MLSLEILTFLADDYSFQKEIATSGYLVASYLKSINFQKTAYLIGSQGFAEELGNYGIKHTLLGVRLLILLARFSEAIYCFFLYSARCDANCNAVLCEWEDRTSR